MDPHAKNLIDDGRNLWLIDWIDGGIATAAVDAAVGAAYWAGDAGWEAGEAFLAGYASEGVLEVPDDALVLAAVTVLYARAAAFGSSRTSGFADVLTAHAR